MIPWITGSATASFVLFYFTLLYYIYFLHVWEIRNDRTSFALTEPRGRRLISLPKTEASSGPPNCLPGWWNRGCKWSHPLGKNSGSSHRGTGTVIPVLPSANPVQKGKWKVQRNEVILKDQCQEVEEDEQRQSANQVMENASPPDFSVRREARDMRN